MCFEAFVSTKQDASRRRRLQRTLNPLPCLQLPPPLGERIGGKRRIGALTAKKGEAILRQRLLSFPKWKCVYELRKMISGSSVQGKKKERIKGSGEKQVFRVTKGLEKP